MPQRLVPLWIKVAYTLLVLIVIPSYWFLLGPTNYLWLSDIALMLLVPAVWLESRLLTSMMAVAVLLLELSWNVDLLLQLLLGVPFTGLAAYMLDPQESVIMRTLSGSFHVVLPLMLLYLIAQIGYGRRAMLFQVPFTWLVLLLSYVISTPEANINFVHGFGHANISSPLPQPWHLLAMMLGIPLVSHLPAHLLLNWWRGNGDER